MTFPSESIHFPLTINTHLKQRHGTGKIIIDSNGVFLKTTTERIPLDASLKDFFYNGEVVKYSSEKETLFLMPLTTETISADASFQDTMSISGNETDQTVSACSGSQSSVINVSSALPTGYYLFTNVEESLHFLEQLENHELSLHLRNEIRNSGVVTIKIDHTFASCSSASIVPFSDIGESLESLRGIFTSEPLRSLPIDIFLETLLSGGSLHIDLLKDIDAALIKMNIALPRLRAGSTDAQHHALLQWFRTVAQNLLPPAESAALVPFASADSMVTIINNLLPTLQQEGTTPQTDGIRYILNENDIHSLGKLTLESAITRIGFDLEHRIANRPLNQPMFSFNDSLKSLLLNSIKSNDNVSRRENSVSPVVTQSDQLEVQTEETVLLQALHNLKSIKNVLTIMVGDHFPQWYESFVKTNNDIDENQCIVPNQSFASAATANGISSRFTEKMKTVLQQLSEDFRSTLLQLHTTAILPPATTPSSESEEVTMPQQMISTTISTIFLKIEQLITNTPSVAADYLKALLETSIDQTDDTRIPFTSSQQKLLSLLKKTLESIDTTIVKLENEKKTGIIVPNNFEAGSGNKNTPTDRTSSEKETVTTNTSLFSFLSKPSTTTALDALESLQLLARKTSGNEGIQQIIALPIKFGDEIAEINIRLLNHRKKKSTGKNRTHFSVFVDVTPPVLGHVHSHINYLKSKRTKIRLEFDKKSSFEWFNKNRSIFTEAIQHGFKNPVSLDLALVHTNETNRKADTFSKKIIDMRA